MKKKKLLVGLGICIAIGGCVNFFELDEDTPTANEQVATPAKKVVKEEPKEEPKPESKKEKVDKPAAWEKQFTEALNNQIKAAFSEIGESPENIESIEYNSTRETDFFDRHNYVVKFSDNRENIFEVFDFEKMGWVHNNMYLITTEQWHEGEGDTNENLVTIKFWTSEDHHTNVLQWSHTGNGELQQ